MCSEGIVERYVNFYTDFAFKKLFGTEINKELLISSSTPCYTEGKNRGHYLPERRTPWHAGIRPARVFDVYCKNEKGEHFIVEMQKGEQQFFKDRSIYYSTFAIREQAPRGDWNYELKGIYTIGILNFSIYPDNTDFYHEIKLIDIDTKEIFYDKLTFIYLEMPKFTKEEDKLETLFDKWLYAIRNLATLMKRPEALQEKVFTRLFEAAEIAKFDRKERYEYEESLKNYRDWISVIETAENKGVAKGHAKGLEEGIAKGRELGEKEKAIAIARQLKDMNIDVEVISRSTGLDIKEIERI